MISTEIQRLQQAKADLATSITNKGVTVPVDATLDDFPALVDSIQGGGSFQYGAEIEFLESTGTQYINTGLKPSSTDYKFELDFAVTEKVTEEKALFGTNNNISTGYPAIIVNDGGKFRYGQTSIGTSVNFAVNTRYSIILENKKLTVNGSAYTSTAATSWAAMTNTLILFARHNGSSVDLHAKMKVYSFRVYDGDTLLADYTPIRIGQVGYMYDKVSGMLFGNAGSGAFTLGPDKN